MKTPELKPCPFCGGKAMIFEVTIEPEEETIKLGCTVCDASIKSSRHQVMVYGKTIYGSYGYVPSGIWTEMSAIEQWNRRADHENT